MQMMLTMSFIRAVARKKSESVPVSDSEEARRKFGNDVKAISSDMYFGKQDDSEVHRTHSTQKHFTTFTS